MKQIAKVVSNTFFIVKKVFIEAATGDSSIKKKDKDVGIIKGRKKDRKENLKNDMSESIKNLYDISDNKLLLAVLFATSETSKAILNRPNVKATLSSLKSKVLTGKDEHYTIIEKVEEQAKEVASILQSMNLTINRIGIDGLPGSGKSTFARALAKCMSMQWRSLDHENMDVPINFSKDLTIYEHHRLFRTQNVDVFDVIIYIDNPVEDSKANILKRTQSGRGSIILDVLDFEKLKKIGKVAFEFCDGKSIPLSDSNLVMKIKGPEGFKMREKLEDILNELEINTKGLSKEEMLFLLAYAKPQKGLKAYFLPGAFNDELLKGLLASFNKFKDS